MKKPTQKFRLYLLRIEHKKTKRKINQKRRIREVITRKINPYSEIDSTKSGQFKLLSPEIFSLAKPDEFHLVVDFIEQLRYAVKQGKRVYIDFSNTKKLYPCGTLLIVAELQRIIENSKNSQIKSNYPKDSVVEQMFQHIGLLHMLGKEPRKEVTASTVIPWSFYHGATPGELNNLDTLKVQYSDPLGEELSHRLLSGISEAITNCYHHAYLENRGDGLDIDATKGWWLFAMHKDGLINVAMCDLGIGIPRSLPQTELHQIDEFKEALSRIGLRQSKDKYYIKAAIDYGISRTKQGHRGKGLSDIINVVKKSNRGGIKIYSNRGLYIYNSTEKRGKYFELAKNIMGTLIQWTFPISQLEQELKNEG